MMLTLPLSIAPSHLETEIASGISSLSNADFSPISAYQSSVQVQEPGAKLGWILIQKRWISAAQLQATLLQQVHQPPDCAKKLGELLVEQAILPEAQIQAALKEQYWRRHGYWVI